MVDVTSEPARLSRDDVQCDCVSGWCLCWDTLDKDTKGALKNWNEIFFFLFTAPSNCLLRTNLFHLCIWATQCDRFNQSNVTADAMN